MAIESPGCRIRVGKLGRWQFLLCVTASALALARSTVLLAQVDCSTCMPERYNYSNPSGNYRVCLDEDIPGNVQSGLAAGLGHWDALFGNHGVGISITVLHGTATEPCGTGDNANYDVLFQAVAPANMTNPTAVAEANLTPNMRGSTVSVSTDYLSNPAYGTDQWGFIGAHETGHLLDYKDVNKPECSSDLPGEFRTS